MHVRIGVDIGGTFTDFVIFDGRTIHRLKRRSTSDRPEEGLVEGIKTALGMFERISSFEIVHGTTVGTNAILEGKGAKTALFTTKGFEDILEIGRQNRRCLYKLGPSKPPPLVPRFLRFGVPERITKDGEILQRVDLSAVEAALEKLKEHKVESIAVCFLFSFANPDHEKEVGYFLRRLGYEVSLSSEILSEYREYERTSTTVLNAKIGPVVTNYVEKSLKLLTDWSVHRFGERFARQLQKNSFFRIMQSNGGVVSTRGIRKNPLLTVLSGPAGGVCAGAALAECCGLKRVITVDMGGTSTDVSFFIEGQIERTTEGEIGGYPFGMPIVSIKSIAAGGGSIVRVDAGGALRVGPLSAGSDPGPICYGRGESITVTDAHLILGRLLDTVFMGGQLRLDRQRTRMVFEQFCRERLPGFVEKEGGIEKAVVGLAQGILDITNLQMAKAIELMTVSKGQDPREFTLMVFGGAGGLHGCDLADALGIPLVVVPRDPGLFCSLGVLLSDVVKDYSLSCIRPLDTFESAEIDLLFGKLERVAQKELEEEGIPSPRRFFSRYVDLRYKGQSFEISLPYSAELTREFHCKHEERYGYSDWSRIIETVTFRLKAVGMLDKISFPRASHRGEETPVPEAILDRRKVFFQKKEWLTPFYLREKLQGGNKLKGPAVIVEYSATTVVNPGYEASVDSFGNLLLSKND
ncbi:hydantoinase/oxoprolinase family protein [Candidatus Methylacidiphilum infernorum]|uniref:Hydantoinase/oxoprolinase family protein n=1 Tax=Candidatus Methylacidiphilum infernorum TaxID=511746 RepID=A0ABX7PTX5_9BACT|nr:hydantoinase/oxoprolinase family protein [Candidatus Methylacidiphilum infernorum]QSR86434.1 hydantoinase/oxoprolinase family protein [Candidatus Methylacidiphilum infernorum]